MKLTTILPLLALSVVPASATVIFIDNFSGTQGVYVSGQNTSNIGPGVIGGYRTMQIAASNNDYAEVAGGELTFGLAAAHSGYALVTWDGDNNNALNENGLAPVDLTSGGLNIFIGLSVRSDLVAPITLTFYSGSSTSTLTYTLNTPGTGFAVPYTDYLISMADFTSSGGANFNNITAATLRIDGTSQPGVDVQVRNYAALPTPEPSTFGLIGAGLIGLASFARRRKA